MRYDDEPQDVEEGARLQHLDAQIDQRLHQRAHASDPQEVLDPELLRDLQEFYQPRAQRFQSGLNRVWDRMGQRGVTPIQPYQRRNGSLTRPDFRQERLHPMSRFSRTGLRWASRASVLVAAVVLFALVGALAVGLVLVRQNGKGTITGGQNTATATSPATDAPTPTSTPFTVTSVDLVVTPDSIAGKSCGSAVSFTYTATFHLPAGHAGGTIQYEYTLNNGRSSTSASVTASPGKRLKRRPLPVRGRCPQITPIRGLRKSW
jgi:hypothetical protein